MPKPPRSQPPTEPNNLTFDFVTHPPRPYAPFAKPTDSPAFIMHEAVHESETPWQIHATPPTPLLPQGYKQTEVGVLPDDWEVVTVYEVAQVGTGSKNTQDRTSEGKYPFFVRSSTIERINTFSYDGEAVLTAGDGVGTGKVFHYINGKFDVHQRVYQISGFHKNIKGYYFYLYFSMFFYERIMKMTAKSSVDSVRLEMITQMPIPLPPLEEQEAIAEALSDADALVDALERLLWKKRRIKEGAMQDLLTGRTRLPGFNGAWEMKRLGEVLSVCHGKSQWEVADENGPYPILATGGEIGRANQFLYDKPSVLIGRKGTINRPQFMDTPFWSVDTLFYTQMHSGHNARYFYYRFCIVDWLKHNEASGVPSLNARTIEQIDLAIPPKEEQEAIAEVLCGMDEEIEALEEKLEKARMVKQGMMQELLTGRIRLV